MKKYMLLSVLPVVIGSFAFADTVDKPAAVEEAKAIAKQFGGTLRKELLGAMQSGGPVNALEVCNIEALPADGACLVCHGQELTGDVQTRLSELYPDDKATGYSPGEVRGAIVVLKNLPQ